MTFDDIERAVITAVVCFPEQALPLVPEVEIDDFGEFFHKYVWTAVRELEAAGTPIGVLAIIDYLFSRYQLANDGRCTERDEADIAVKLGTLFVLSPHSGDADEHCKRLAKYARALRTIRHAREERLAG